MRAGYGEGYDLKYWNRPSTPWRKRDTHLLFLERLDVGRQICDSQDYFRFTPINPSQDPLPGWVSHLPGALPSYPDSPRRERALLFYLYTLMRSGSGALSTTNSGCSRRNVSAMWQFQQTGRCVFIVSCSFSVGISLHSTVFRSASTSAGGWSCQCSSPKALWQYAHSLPSYQRLTIVKTRQARGASSICCRHSCPQASFSGQREHSLNLSCSCPSVASQRRIPRRHPHCRSLMRFRTRNNPLSSKL